VNNKEVSLSVVMPMYNAASTIERCLAPLLAMQESGEVAEIIVVDDCSTDDSPEIVRALPVRVLRTSGQGGPGAARNLAAQEAQGSVIWFVDSDVIVNGDAAQHISRGFADPAVAAVFGSYDDEPGDKGFLSQYKNLVHRYYHQRARTDASTFWAGCGAIRRDSFLELGGFDTARYPYPSIEDIELGGRIVQSGARISLLPELQGKHLKKWKFVNLVHTEIFRRAIPWSRLMLARGKLTDDLNVSTDERLRAVAAGVFVLALLAAITGWLSWSVVPVILALLLILNLELLRFFLQQRGFWFALGAFAYHQFYYLYSMAAFAYAWLEIRLRSIETQA
jgi:glycosyltransferase involved in cell wall biosynthesis